MNTKSSALNIIQSHAPNIKVRLYTPAHQEKAGLSTYFPDFIYQYDFPFLTRNKTEKLEEYFSKLYQTKHTIFLTGGATQGILVACMLLARKHRKVMIGLNSHIAVINGLILSGLEPIFIPSHSIMPSADEVIAALENATTEVKALLLTHPSYEGITIDIQAIVRYCQSQNIELIVDEAHGTHFPFLSSELNSVLVHGGDLVVHSLHKYIGSFVQTALLHLPENSKITPEEVMGALSLLESTTRSNLLILSIEDAIQTAFGEQGVLLFAKAANNCDRLRSQIQEWGPILSCDPRVRDPLKLFLTSDRASPTEISELLYQRGIDQEYADEQGVLLIFSFQHTEVDFEYVKVVLTEIYQILAHQLAKITLDWNHITREPIMRMLPREAFFSQRESLCIQQAQGRISATSIKKVPPGSPILIPGEEITQWHLQKLSIDTLVEVIR